MNRVAFKRAGAGMAVQAFAVIVWGVELDFFRARGSAKILDVDVMESAEFCTDVAVQGVVGMAREAGLVHWYAVVLEMLRCHVGRIVDHQAFAVGFHDMAGKAELRSLRAVDLLGGAPRCAQERQEEKSAERKNFSFPALGNRRANHNHSDQDARDDEQGVKEHFRRRQTHAFLRSICTDINPCDGYPEGYSATGCYFFASSRI